MPVTISLDSKPEPGEVDGVVMGLRRRPRVLLNVLDISEHVVLGQMVLGADPGALQASIDDLVQKMMEPRQHVRVRQAEIDAVVRRMMDGATSIDPDGGRS